MKTPMKNWQKYLGALTLGALLAITGMQASPASSGIAGATYNPSSMFMPYFAPGTTLQYLRGDMTWQTLPIASPMTFNNAATHPIVMTAAAANGFQLSATRNVSVFYSVNVVTTATIAGASDGYIVLEISPTNSTTASDWKEVSRSRNGQTLSLAIALQSVQNIGSELMNIVPAGYYARLRAVTVNGSPVFSYVSGQEATL